MSGDGKWKLHLPHSYRTLIDGGKDGVPGKYKHEKLDYTLYDMVYDLYEKANVLDRYPNIAEKLKEFTRQHKEKYYPTTQ